MMRTHHEPGSAEERYSRQMRFDKYLAMHQLLMQVANPHSSAFEEFGAAAKDILAGMVRPRSVWDRIDERAKELRALAAAYEAISEGADAAHIPERAAAITVEALKAWERAHPPAPIDPLLYDR